MLDAQCMEVSPERESVESSVGWFGAFVESIRSGENQTVFLLNPEGAAEPFLGRLRISKNQRQLTAARPSSE